MKIVGSDAGKGRTKFSYVDEAKEVQISKFDTRMTKITNLNDTDIVGSNNFKAEYEGNKYIVGSQGEVDATDKRSKKSELHKIATLVAITQALGPEEDEVALISSIPAATYKSSELKAEYVELYKGKVEIEVNNTPYKFEIKEVLLLPESIGFKFKYPKQCQTGRVCIIDIGKYNIGLVVIENGAIKQMETLDYGGIQLENIVASRLETKFDIGVSRNKIHDYIKNGFVKKWGEDLEDSALVISEGINIYLDGIILEAIKKNVDLESMDKLHFIGGISLLIENSIKDHVKYSKLCNIPEDADTVSVVGNLFYGVKKFNG